MSSWTRNVRHDLSRLCTRMFLALEMNMGKGKATALVEKGSLSLFFVVNFSAVC